MSNMHLVTGRAGEKHVSAADEGALNAAVFGSGQYVLNEGGKMAATVVSNNAVRIADGAAMFHGRYIRLEGYEDLTIESGTQGTYRNDLIVIRYTKDTTANTESAKLVVIKGTANSTTAADPAYVSGNILEGAVQADMPLYRIPLDNVNIGTPVALFEMIEDNVGNLSGKQEDTKNLMASTTLADGDYFPFYDVSAGKSMKTLWSNIVAKIKTAILGTTSGFVKADGSGGISGVSTIPIANGGTDANTRKAAALNLLFLGTNPVTTDTDKASVWAEMGTGFAYFNSSSTMANKPTSFGYLLNFVNSGGGNLVQVWLSLAVDRQIFLRSGNSTQWYDDDAGEFATGFTSDNLNPATLDSYGKVNASQISADIIRITASTTLAATHCGRFLYTDSSSAITLTIPDSTNLPVGTEIEIKRWGSGAAKIQCASGIYLRGIGSLAAGETYAITDRYGSAVIKKVTSTAWCIDGAVDLA